LQKLEQNGAADAVVQRLGAKQAAQLHRFHVEPHGVADAYGLGSFFFIFCAYIEI
jgi:hypothetical protein